MRLSSLFESNDSIPNESIELIKKTIKDAAVEPSVVVLNILSFVNEAFKTNNVTIPNPSLRGAWAQYESMITFAVEQLHNATKKGIRDNTWTQLSVANQILGL